VADYYLQTIWRIEAPLEQVYSAVEDSLCWPQWWPSVLQVAQTDGGDEHGINNVRRYCWRGKLPYLMLLEVCATRIDRGVAIEGAVQGDLEGVGRWDFSRHGALSVVRFEWHVHSTRWWMNLLAPIARPLFIRNHEQIMAQGGQALAAWLGAPLHSQETIDLMANPTCEIPALTPRI